MKNKRLIIVTLFFIFLLGCSKLVKLEETIQQSVSNYDGVVVFADLKTDNIIYSNKMKASEKYPPCSTFKIWNTLIGIEKGLITSPNDEFYKWDNKVRFIPDWNKDLNFKEAFKVSCVPAFQDLAKKIGTNFMQDWINKINYGDKNISSGIEIFWLPREGEKPILITPEQQALLIKELINKKLLFSKKALNILKEVMLVKQTDKGTLFGKTGSGENVQDIPNNNIGWFVGYVVSEKGSYSFACIIRGKHFYGKQARAIIEKILTDTNFL